LRHFESEPYRFDFIPDFPADEFSQRHRRRQECEMIATHSL
jgi:hypothetical protein